MAKLPALRVAITYHHNNVIQEVNNLHSLSKAANTLGLTSLSEDLRKTADVLEDSLRALKTALGDTRKA